MDQLLREGTRVLAINANQRAVKYYERLGFHLVPDSYFVHPQLNTPSHIMFLTADPTRDSKFQRLFAQLSDPLPFKDVLAELSQEESTLTEETKRVDREQQLGPGIEISFSAGSTSRTSTKYRIVEPQPMKLANLIGHFPSLGALLNGQDGIPLMIINAYPASVDKPDSAIFVDTYGREATISKSLLLAAQNSNPTVLIGQPLMIAERLLQHVRRSLPLPKKLVLFVGGYTCPCSLETFVTKLLEQSGCEDVQMVHLYGVAEINAGLMGAMHRDEDSRLIYQPIDTVFSPVIKGDTKRLCFRTADTIIETDEFARQVNGSNGLVLWSPSAVEMELEQWDENDWSRYTGYVAREQEKLIVQLRSGGEMKYGSFVEEFETSWFEKPSWQ